MNLQTMHISMGGKDFLQIQQQVRTLLKLGYKGAIEVLVEPGKYFFDKPFVLTSEDCGEAPITYRANLKNPEDEVVLTGAKSLGNLCWEIDEDNPNIRVTQIAQGLEIDGLVVDGMSQILCRYPNFVAGAVPLGSATDAATLKERVATYKKVETGYVRALHDYRWGGNSYKVVGRDANACTGLALEWVGDNNRGSRFDETALVIENIREELDAPGEWFYDKETGKLYFYPLEGMQLEQAQCEVVVTSEILRCVGDQAGKKVRNITFEGFKLAHTKRILFTTHEADKAYVPLLRGDWCVVRSGAIYVQDAEQLTFRELTLEHIGGNGIFMSGYNRGHIIENSTIRHMGASGVQIVGLPEAVHQPSFWDHDHYPELKVHQSVVDHPELTGPRTED
ncbi:MAG: right-handed parallel beta-helix repeat-containing protein, partial [Cellulosilyticaceae bacterium]